SIRGKPLEACFSPEIAHLIHERYRTVALGAAAMHSSGAVYIRDGRNGAGERIVLPLADDGIHADGVLGATVYRFTGKHPQAHEASVGHSGEIVQLFPLGDGEKR